MKTTPLLIFILAAVICVVDCASAPAGQLWVGASSSLSSSGTSSGRENLPMTFSSPKNESTPALQNLSAHKPASDKTWQAALSRMPLGTHVTELNRTNAIPLMLNAFQSNNVIKGLIFMPGAADDFVFYRRAHATLTNQNPSLADAIIALTNQTYIHAEFRPPFLLLYTTEDALDPMIRIKSQSTAAKLQSRVVPGRIVLWDCNWDYVRPKLHNKLSVGLRPFPNSPGSWHFWPNNFAACGLTQWQLLEAIALSGKTTFTLHWRTADFQLDTRSGPVQNLTNFPGQ